MKWNGRPEYEDAEIATDPVTGQEVIITHHGAMFPVVGELSNKTTPQDWERFRELAAAFWAQHRTAQVN